MEPGRTPTALKESGGIAQFRKLDNKSKDWKLLYGTRPGDELYNVEDDPECVNNLAGNPEYAKRMNALRSTLLKQLREQADPRVLGGEVLFDSYPATTPWLPIHKARVKWEKENARN